MTQIELTWEQWFQQFHPVRNHLDMNANYKGYMFEIYGEELDYVVKVYRRGGEYRIWTLLEEDGTLWISEGFHIVNRLGYFITMREFSPTGSYIVDRTEGETETYQIQVTAKKISGEILHVLRNANGHTEKLEPIYITNGEYAYRVQGLHNDRAVDVLLHERYLDEEELDAHLED